MLKLGISGNQLLIYAYLSNISRKSMGILFELSTKRMAQAVGVSTATALKNFHKLEEKGLIKHGKKGSLNYIFLEGK